MATTRIIETDAGGQESPDFRVVDGGKPAGESLPASIEHRGKGKLTSKQFGFVLRTPEQ